MKAYAIIGKTIARVEQVRTDLRSQGRGVVWDVRAIHFTDGSCLRFGVKEGDNDYYVSGIYPARVEP